jgi:predicted MPP superfamily phosphohydrolase
MTDNKTKTSEINILHLSDLHYDSSKPRDTQIVLDALWKDLDHFPDIDFILFTGDLVKIGDKKDDFDSAYEVFIDPLLQKTQLTRDEFFIVPGNHDMQMGAIDPITEEGLRTALIDRETLNAFLDKEIEKDFPHIERLDHFNAFKSQFHSTHTITSNKLFSTHILQKSSAKIGIACLNSSWRATGKGSSHDKGKLLIGERQIYDAFQDIKDCNIKIALFHHALDWLSEYDLGDAKKMFYREFDLIFCGHLHDPNLELVQNFGNQTLLIQSGCLYKGRSFYNGFSILHLDAPKGEGTIHLRTYFDDRHEFDKALNKCKDGQVSIKLKSEKEERPLDEDPNKTKKSTENNTTQKNDPVIKIAEIKHAEGDIITIGDSTYNF